MLNKDDFRELMLFWLSKAEESRKFGYERKAEFYEARAAFYAKKLLTTCAYCDFTSHT